jgi:hypothetical protein
MVKYNCILFLQRDGVLQMTMDGNLIHNISIPSKENDYKTCMYSVTQGIEKVCC